MPRRARETEQKANSRPRNHQVKYIYIYIENPSLQAQKHFPINQFLKTAGSAVNWQ
jgi:hypothetical protein